MVAASEVQPQAQSGKSPNSKEASPSKATEASVVDPKQEAANVLAAGKRNLLVSDIPQAVEALREACELFTKVYGETAPECAEAYFFYGKSLLEMARLENGVLGNALDGVPEDEDKAETSQVEDPEKLTEEEKVDVEEKVDEALVENFEKHDKIAKIHKGEVLNGDTESEEGEDSQEESAEDEGEEKKDVDKAEKKDADISKSSSEKEVETATEGGKAEETPMDTEAEAEKSDKDSDVVGEDKEGEDKSAQEAEDEEDPSNLQLAWEMLELAKVVYTTTLETTKGPELEQRLETIYTSSNLTIQGAIEEIYMILGEVSLENENYPQAVEDLEICLKKRMEALAKDSRCIAETHYQLGIAQGFDMKWEEAVVSLEAAIKVLESRIENLKKETASPDEEKKDDAFHTQEKEIAEIEALIPEIKEKITDTNEMKAESLRKMKEAVGLPSGSGSSSFDASTSASTAKPIASIAVKRKAEDKDAESKVAESKDESSAKKSKEEASVVENIDAKVA